MPRVHITQTAGVAVLVQHVVPRRCRAGAVLQRAVEVDIGHQPRRPLQTLRGGDDKVGRVLHDARRHKHRQRDDAALCLPALDVAAGVVECIHGDAVALLGNAQHAAAAVQLAGGVQRRRQLARQPAIALGPGQHAFGFIGVVGVGVAGRAKTVPAGKVMDARPSRHPRTAGAVIVAAAVVQVPAQVRIIQPLSRQPTIKIHSIKRLLDAG